MSLQITSIHGHVSSLSGSKPTACVCTTPLLAAVTFSSSHLRLKLLFLPVTNKSSFLLASTSMVNSGSAVTVHDLLNQIPHKFLALAPKLHAVAANSGGWEHGGAQHGCSQPWWTLQWLGSRAQRAQEGYCCSQKKFLITAPWLGITNTHPLRRTRQSSPICFVKPRMMTWHNWSQGSWLGGEALLLAFVASGYHWTIAWKSVLDPRCPVAQLSSGRAGWKLTL